MRFWKSLLFFFFVICLSVNLCNFVFKKYIYLYILGCESEIEVAQLCPTLCHPMDCSLPGSPVHGLFQARILMWVAISFSRGSSQPRNETWVFRIVGRPSEPPGKSFWLYWVFVASRAFFELQRAGVLSSCGAQASPCGGFSCCGPWALGRAGFGSCSSKALAHSLSSCGSPA